MIYDKKETKEIAVPENYQSKFVISDEEVLQLAKWAVNIEDHYKKPMDIEWAKDGKTNKLFIVQARPETVHALENENNYEQYILKEKGKIILEGKSIGSKIVSGKVKIIPDVEQIKQFNPGEILVTRMTDPDWTSVMSQAKAIITEEGGRTCHAAIVSRELGIPCIVGTGKATRVLNNGKFVTADCSESQIGRIWDGELKFEIKKINLEKFQKPDESNDEYRPTRHRFCQFFFTQ